MSNRILGNSFRRGTQKPSGAVQLDIAHPLARGLVCAWIFLEGAGNNVQDVSGNGNNGTLSGEDSSLVWNKDASPSGSAVLTNGATASTGFIKSAPLNNIPLANGIFSVACKFRIPIVNIAVNQPVWSLDDGATGTTQCSLQFRTTPALAVTKAGGSALVTAPSSPTQNLWHDTLYVSGAPNPNESLYIDGALVATATVATNSNIPTRISIGNDTFAGTAVAYEYFLIWNRALSQGEYEQFVAAPYEMFK